jgi:glycyl-tRNA synthetase beta chain
MSYATSTNTLLVELLTEELPPKALSALSQAFSAQLADELRSLGYLNAHSNIASFATPRRLAVSISQVAAVSPDQAVQEKLLPASIGLDANGQATAPLLKKLQALGLSNIDLSQLERIADGKQEQLVYRYTAPGKPLADGLQQALDHALHRLPIPKLMSYQRPDGQTVQFVRPVHGLLALHGADIIPLQAFGLQADRITQGHRFEADAPVLTLDHADDYAALLERRGAVVAGFATRRARILAQLQAAAQRLGGLTIILDEALLDEVTALVERPNVLAGRFDPGFLQVPAECLILTMQANQKYFPLVAADGALTEHFLIVSNLTPVDASAIIRGNERVIRPRLADAKFFFDQDRKKPLIDRLPALAKVVYHNRLGSQLDRVERVRARARAIVAALGDEALGAAADRAAQLAKADLLTDMVGEFPELQGTMGRYYALHDHEDPLVADAIEDHYKPRFAGDTLPRGRIGQIVALADKLETLTGLFGIGQLPTGDKDPFALRRQALGVIRILIEGRYALSVQTLCRIDTNPEATGLLIDFVYDRLAANLRDEHAYSTPEINAVLGLRPDHLHDVPARLLAVRAFAALPEAQALAAANKRVGNILKKSGPAAGDVQTALLQEPAEIELHERLNQIAPRTEEDFRAARYQDALMGLAALRPTIDRFFETVMVMAEAAEIRQNRLALLAQMHRLTNQVADLSQLTGV